MKNTKYLLFVLLVSAAYDASAQFSAGLELGFPLGNFSDIARTGFGGSLRYDQIINHQLAWTASAGLLSFDGKTFTSGNASIPFGNSTNSTFAAGVKYYFSDAGSGFYGGLDLSLNFLSTYAVYIANSGNGSGNSIASDNVTKFGVNPGLGYRLHSLDFCVRYNALGDFSYFGIRAAFVFPTRK